MSWYDPERPFRVWYSAPLGRGARLKTEGYCTLAEARAAAKSLSCSSSLILITDGPDDQLIKHTLNANYDSVL
jgi:hypothetical protein